ncbi:MAG TPA: PDZ domain-containing protein [Flavilitoribacter sp.]|nr:PDZ domain-containing protein [Flavilitoribacter sp.]
MKSIQNTILQIAISLLTIQFAAAQPTRLLRQPDIHGDRIVFEYGGDLWTAAKTGGQARHLTSFQGVESDPKFSPDGTQIAFTGVYGGNQDVYVVPAEGGEPQRLTWHPAPDIVRGWSPDGKVVFTSPRESAPDGSTKMWQIGLNETFPQALPMPRAYRGTYSPDGASYAYELVAPWDIEWRNYRGGQNRPVWVLDLKSHELKTLPWQNSKDQQPVWLGNKIYFLSDRDFAMNIYSYDTRTSALEQLTTFAEYDVKQLAGSGNTLIFEYGGDLYTLDPATKASTKISIEVKGDFPWLQPHWKAAGDLLGNASLSPGAKRVLFEARGEIITVPVEKGDPRNLTNSPGARDHDPVWSPDGKSVAWFSDVSGEYSLMVGAQDGLTPPREIKIPSPTFYYSPTWSPDGKYIAYTDHLQQLWMINVSTGKTTLVDQDLFLHPERTINPVWSPDSKWIAYSRRLPSEYHAIFAWSIDQSKSLQLTDGLSDAVSPAWDASGKYLYFLASTNLALASGWLDMSSIERPIRRSVYFMVLKKGEPSPLLPESDEPEGGADAEKDKTPDKAPEEKADAKKEPAVKVQIDVDGLSQRILAIDMPPRDYVLLKTGAGGELYIAENVQNQDGATLHKFSLKDRKGDKFLSPVNEFALSPDGTKLLYQSGGQWGVVETAGKPNIGDGAVNVSGVQIRVDPRKEWKQIFREGWRYQRDYLYVKNVHGADWNKIYDMYAPLVDHAAHRSDLTYLLDILGGEVSIGHSFTGGGDNPEVKPVPIGLLGADLEVAGNRYRIRKIYTGENWNPGLRAPLSTPGVDVSEGDYLISVDGNDLTTARNPYSLFENKANKQVVLKVSRDPSGAGARQVKVVPVGNEDALRTFAWVEGNRRKVDELTNGQIAYVWLPNTAEDGYAYFNRYYFAQQHKKGVILDERYNGGGYIADYFVDILNRQLRGYFNNPAGKRTPWTEPLTGIFGPKVMIINEMAGSGGDMLPYMFKEMQLGPLVGTKTWGGLVGIWDTPGLIDGGYITAPRGGFFNLDGEWDVENKGITPNIEVEMTPKEVIMGHDPQLERAAAEAMRLLKEHPVELKAEPAAPVRAIRPKK